MDDLQFKLLNRVLVDAFTKYQGAIMEHGVKDLADKLKKSKSTIYAEISLENLATYMDTIQNYDEKKPAYLPKLGLVDFLIGVFVSGEKQAFVALASFLNMACFELPAGNFEKGSATKALVKNSQEASRECTESFNVLVEALAGDGIVDKKEARRTSMECGEAINAIAKMKAAADWIAQGQ